jgi:hypothetical protein
VIQQAQASSRRAAAAERPVHKAAAGADRAATPASNGSTDWETF